MLAAGQRLGARLKLQPLNRSFRSSRRLNGDDSSDSRLKLNHGTPSAPKNASEWSTKPIGTKIPPPRAMAPPRVSGSTSKPQIDAKSSFSVDSLEALPSELKEVDQTDINEESAIPTEGGLMSTSHMTGLIQRVAYHLMFRPQAGKASGKLPIQIASLSPTHSLNSIAGVLQSIVQMQPTMEAIKTEGPPRYVLILVPTEAYKFQAMQMIEKAQISRHKSWTLLTEDEFWCALFPGYSNLMTPYIDATGCVVLPHGAAAQNFTENAFIAPAPHSTLTWAHAIEQNAQAHVVKSNNLNQTWPRNDSSQSHQPRAGREFEYAGNHNYCLYSARELIWAILRPQTEFDSSHRLARLQHAVHALKATYLTDIIPFNTSMETLSLLASLHDLVGRVSVDSTFPNVLSSFHPDIPLSTSKLPKRPQWTPNISFALDLIEFSDVQIPYLATTNADVNEPEWEEHVLEHLSKSPDQRGKSVHFGFWEGTKANSKLVSRAFFADPFPMYHQQVKQSFRNTLQRDPFYHRLDTLFAPTAHLELQKEAVPEIIRPLLALANEALATRDIQAVPLRILCQNNLDLVSLMDTLEMQGLPTFSQSLFATPAVRMVCDLFTILIELSKQSVLARARKLEEEAQAQSKSENSENSASTTSEPIETKRHKKKLTNPKSELHWEGDAKANVNLAAAFHSLLHGAYGYNTILSRKVESRIMYQFIKFKDPMMSLLLGIATQANYMKLDPTKARKRANRHSTRDIVAEERHKMTAVEFEASVKLATEDAHMMIDLLQSPTTPFRTKALAAEILRLQQALSKQEVQSRNAAHPQEASLSNSNPSSESSSLFDHQALGSDANPTETQNQTSESTESKMARLQDTSHKRHRHSGRKRSFSAPVGTTKRELTAEEMKDQVYSARSDKKAALGAKNLYQDLAYLISAMRAMPLSPSEIIDLFIARHVHRAEAAIAQVRNPTTLLDRASFRSISDESIELMKAFSKSLKGLSHASNANASDLNKSASPADVLTENYISNANFLQKAVHFVKHAFVESPYESYELATKRARSATPAGATTPYRYPIFLNIDDFSHGSGDFAVTLRVLPDPHIAAQPNLLPPPAPFLAQLSLYGSQERLSADRGLGIQDGALRNEFEMLKSRRILSSSVQFSFTTSKFPHPGIDYNQVPYKDSYTLKNFVEKMENLVGTDFMPNVPTLAFENHPINNPRNYEVDEFFELQQGQSPTTPKVGSKQIDSIVDTGPQSAYNMLSPSQMPTRLHQTPHGNRLPLDYHHPAMELPREILGSPVSMQGPSFLFFGAYRPFEIGSTSIRVFRECQVLFALRYVWSVEPGKPASIHATTGMALHEAASRVHSQVLEKLAQALKETSAPLPTRALAPPETGTDTAEGDVEGTVEIVEGEEIAEDGVEGDADEISETAAAASEDASGELTPTAEVTTEIDITEEDAKVVHETLIETVFKQSIMSSQGLSAEEADQLMAQPEYRKHVEQAKKRTLWQWEKEQKKQLEIGKKHKLKKEKERVEKEKAAAKKLKKEKAAAQVKSSAEKVAPSDDAAATPSDLAPTETISDESKTVSEEAKVLDQEAVVGDEPEILGQVKEEFEDETSTAWKKLPGISDVDVLEEPKEEEDFTSLYSFSEQEFAFKLPTGHVWKGAWDRIDIDPETGGVEITEYKTSLRRNRLTGLFQLQTYALAYWKVHHVIPTKLTLASLSTSATEEYIPTKLDLIRTENLILATLQNMANGIFTPTNRPSLCISCHYSQQCPSALTASPLYENPFTGSHSSDTSPLISSDGIIKDLPHNNHLKEADSTETSNSRSTPHKKHHHHKKNAKDRWRSTGQFHIDRTQKNPLDSSL